MSMNIKVTGIASTSTFLALKSKEATKRAEDAIKKAGFYIQGEVVQSISGRRAEHRSVDTGFFMNSILSIFPTKLSANIGSNKYPVKYGPHLEYGTSRFRGRFHFKNTKTRNEKKIKDFINDEIKKI